MRATAWKGHASTKLSLYAHSYIHAACASCLGVLCLQRLQAAVQNYLGLLVNSRNLDFFTSFYRFLIQLLPAAVVSVQRGHSDYQYIPDSITW